MQKDFGGAHSSFYLEPAFQFAELCLPQQQESPVEMQKSELGHAITFRDFWKGSGGGEIQAWNVAGKQTLLLVLSPCRTNWKKQVQLAVTSCLGQKAKSNMPMNLIPLLFTSNDSRKVELCTVWARICTRIPVFLF